MRPPDRDRSRASAISAGMRWASTISTIGLEMALPPLAGVWLDEKFDTSPVWVLVLSILGFIVAMMHLWQLAKRLRARNSRSDRSDRQGTKT